MCRKKGFDHGREVLGFAAVLGGVDLFVVAAREGQFLVLGLAWVGLIALAFYSAGKVD